MRILSLKINSHVEDELTALRDRYFPSERNYLRAHITLFHALPDDEGWRAHLEDVCQTQKRFSFRLGPAYSLGRGVALRIESPELLHLREILAAPWRMFLSKQDLQRYNPHCTLQNKVEPVQVALKEIQARDFPREGEALGLTLSLYKNGPWKHVRDFDFR